MEGKDGSKLKVAIIHPDLGIGNFYGVNPHILWPN